MSEASKRRAVEVEAPPVRVSVRVYFSTYHLWSARRFSDDCRRKEEALLEDAPVFDIEHRAYASSSIIAAVAFLEANVQELLRDAVDRHPSYVGDLKDEVLSRFQEIWDEAEASDSRSLSTLEKYEQMLEAAECKGLDRGADPYQSVKLLVEVRNELIHYVPGGRAARGHDRLRERLRGRFPANRLMADTGNPFFPDHCLGSGCTAWAVRSVERFAEEVASRLDVVPNHQRVDLEPVVPGS